MRFFEIIWFEIKSSEWESVPVCVTIIIIFIQYLNLYSLWIYNSYSEKKPRLSSVHIKSTNFNQINIEYSLRILEYNYKFQIINKHFSAYDISVSITLSLKIMRVLWYCYSLLMLTD